MELRINTSNLRIDTNSSPLHSATRLVTPLSAGEIFLIQSTSPLARAPPRNRSATGTARSSRKRRKRFSSVALFKAPHLPKRESISPAHFTWFEDEIDIDRDEDLFAEDSDGAEGALSSTQSSAFTSAASTGAIEQQEFATILENPPFRPAPAVPDSVAVTSTMEPAVTDSSEEDDYNLAEPIHNLHETLTPRPPTSIAATNPTVFMGKAAIVHTTKPSFSRLVLNANKTQAPQRTLQPPVLKQPLRSISPQRGPALAWTADPADSRFPGHETEAHESPISDSPSSEALSSPHQSSPTDSFQSPQGIVTSLPSAVSTGDSLVPPEATSPELAEDASQNDRTESSNWHPEPSQNPTSQRQPSKPVPPGTATPDLVAHPSSSPPRQVLERLHIPPLQSTAAPELISSAYEEPSPVSPIDDDLPLLASTQVYARSIHKNSFATHTRSSSDAPNLQHVGSATTSLTTLSRASEAAVSSRSASEHHTQHAPVTRPLGSGMEAREISSPSAPDHDASRPEAGNLSHARHMDQPAMMTFHPTSSQTSMQQLSRTSSTDNRRDVRRQAPKERVPSLGGWSKTPSILEPSDETLDSTPSLQFQSDQRSEQDIDSPPQTYALSPGNFSPYEHSKYQQESLDRVNELPDYRPAGRLASQTAVHRSPPQRMTDGFPDGHYNVQQLAAAPQLGSAPKSRKSRFGFGRSSQSSGTTRLKTSDEVDDLQAELNMMRGGGVGGPSSARISEPPSPQIMRSPSIGSSKPQPAERGPSRAFGFGRSSGDSKSKLKKQSSSSKSTKDFFTSAPILDEMHAKVLQQHKLGGGTKAQQIWQHEVDLDRRNKKPSKISDGSKEGDSGSLLHGEPAGRGLRKESAPTGLGLISAHQPNMSQASVASSHEPLAPNYRDELARSGRSRITSNQAKMEDLQRRMSTMGY